MKKICSLLILAIAVLALPGVAFADKSIKVDWVNIVGNAGYAVEMKTAQCADPGSFTIVGNVAADVVTFTTTSQPANAWRCLRVLTLDVGSLIAGTSAPVEVQIPPPLGPTVITVSIVP